MTKPIPACIPPTHRDPYRYRDPGRAVSRFEAIDCDDETDTGMHPPTRRDRNRIGSKGILPLFVHLNPKLYCKPRRLTSVVLQCRPAFAGLLLHSLIYIPALTRVRCRVQ
jgi:hypothetical protein